MSTILEALQPVNGRSQIFRMSVEFYHELGRLGMLGEKEWELLDGLVIERMPKSPLHEYIANMLVQLLAAILPQGQFVSKESSFSAARSEPIPDVMVLSGLPADYAFHHPTTALWVAEVCLTSERMDRAKAAIYAAAGVREFWLVQPEEGWIEINTQPVDQAYTQVLRFAAHETAPSQSITGFSLRLADILPTSSSPA